VVAAYKRHYSGIWQKKLEKNDRISVGIPGLSLEILTQYLPNEKQFTFPRGCDEHLYRVI